MLAKSTDAIVLLYPSKNQSIKEIREALGKFCAGSNLTIIDIIMLDNEYDQSAMKRFVQAIAYNTKPCVIVTNKNMFRSMLPLSLWSMLGIINSNKITISTQNFLSKIKDNVSELNSNGNIDFYLLNCKEVGYLANWITEVKYYMEYENNQKN